MWKERDPRVLELCCRSMARGQSSSSRIYSLIPGFPFKSWTGFTSVTLCVMEWINWTRQYFPHSSLSLPYFSRISRTTADAVSRVDNNNVLYGTSGLSVSPNIRRVPPLNASQIHRLFKVRFTGYFNSFTSESVKKIR